MSFVLEGPVMDVFSNPFEKIRTDSLVYYHDGTIPDIAIPSRDLNIEWVTRELINTVVESNTRRERFCHFLDSGYSGLLVHDNESWTAYGWICTPKSDSVPIQLPDWIGDLDIYWFFFDRTREGDRGEGWHKYLLAERLRAIYEYDLGSSIYIDTDVDNVSRFSILSSGFDTAGMLRTYSLGYPPFDVKKIGRWNWDTAHPPLPESE